MSESTSFSTTAIASPPAPASIATSTSTPTPGPAAITLGSTPDIISHVLSFLPQPALAKTLRVSKMYFHLSAPLLYHTIDIKHGMKDISIGSTRSEADDLTLDSFSKALNSSSSSKLSYGKGGSHQLRNDDFSKNSLLRLVKRVDVHVHGKNECPFVSNYIQLFPNLQVLHLAGGQWPDGMEPDDVCAYDRSYYGSRSSDIGEMRCQFVRKVCMYARRVILRSLDFSPIKGYGKVEHVILKLRPCQLPHYTPRRTSGPSARDDDHSIDNWNTISMKLPPLVKTIDIIWWDERHVHRLEGYEVTLDAKTSYWMGGRGGDNRSRMLGCTYCDQAGCIRYSPHAGVQLPGMMRSLGKDTSVDRVRVWNVDYTAEEQWPDDRLSLDQLKMAMLRELREGRKVRLGAKVEEISRSDDYIEEAPPPDFSHLIYDSDHPLDLPGDSDPSKPTLSFHSAAEYYARATGTASHFYHHHQSPPQPQPRYNHADDLDCVCEIDDEESPYWVGRIKPPRRLKNLRERVEAIWPMEDKRMLSLWSADELERYLDNYEKDLDSVAQ
ncbi:hypothetical protein IAT40_007169 [Kwoniella sp. CBS 6097]